ncbi:MAG: hypothetical protein CL670_08910 [Balneola sp.]|jgi:hypothetical protein|nr:hypothetical protein [Balneola sp.]MBE79258.1 hypothetical protein [Balneola sp.]HBX64931.1 hypothetical protein [Balneolaceae bacterium]|tara:strand:- start:302 stop:898 length:597 start_codon:yes stop_codon:yes gene_type:complete
MNFGIIISYIIAGFLSITILMVTYNVGFSNQEVTTTLIKKTHSRSIQDIIVNDIPKIGYQNKTVLANKFVTADSDEISFYSDLNNDGTINQITWKYTDLPSPGSKNPNDNILRRTVDGDETEINVGVTSFTIRYYDEYGSTTPMATPISSSNFDDIIQIEVELELQSSYDLSYRNSDDENYITTSWQKRFSPVNLRPN